MKNERQVKAIDMVFELENRLNILLVKLEKVDQAKMEIAPDPQSWSATQIIEHLYLAETRSWRGVEKRLKSGEIRLENMKWKTKIVELGADYSLRLPIRAKAPKQVDPVRVKLDHNFSELINLWQQDRAALRSWLMEAPVELFEKTCYGHPVFGWMSLVGMVYFFRGHFDRHEKQLFRTISRL